MAAETKQIILGSGDLYVTEYNDDIPEHAEIELEANLLGRIKGGASVEYKPSEHTVADDSGAVEETFITAEDVTFKSGVLTWNIATLNKLTAASVLSEAAGTRTLAIGGRAGRRVTKYLIRFVHTKSDGKKIRATLVGTASSGFTLAFAPDKETVVDAQFKGVSHNTSGHKLILEEEYIVA